MGISRTKTTPFQTCTVLLLLLPPLTLQTRLQRMERNWNAGILVLPKHKDQSLSSWRSQSRGDKDLISRRSPSKRLTPPDLSSSQERRDVLGNNHLFWPYKKASNRPDQGEANPEEKKTENRKGRTNRREQGRKTKNPKTEKNPESKGRNQRMPLQEKPRKKEKKKRRTRKGGVFHFLLSAATPFQPPKATV